MAIRPETLDTPERGQAPLQTREPEERQSRGPASELRALRDRIETARSAKHPTLEADQMQRIRAQCRDCATKGFAAGWTAALAALTADD